jgi:hypothetical protein
MNRPVEIWEIIFDYLLKLNIQSNSNPRGSALQLHLLSTTEKNARRAYEKLSKYCPDTMSKFVHPPVKEILGDVDAYILYLSSNDAETFIGHMGRRYTLDARGKRKYIDTLPKFEIDIWTGRRKRPRMLNYLPYLGK